MGVLHALRRGFHDRWRECFAPTFAAEKGEQQDGIGHVVTIVTAVVAGTAAVITFLQETGTSKISVLWFIYVPAFVLPIGALKFMRYIRNDTDEYYFNPPTRRAANWGIAVTTIILFAIVVAGSYGQLPGQKPPEATVLRPAVATAYTWKNAPFPAGMIVSIDLDHENIRQSYPNHFEVHASLRQPLTEKWSIAKMVLVDATVGRQERQIQTHEFADIKTKTPPDDVVAYFDSEPTASDRSYRVDIYLYSSDASALQDIEQDSKLIMEGKVLKAELPAEP